MIRQGEADRFFHIFSVPLTLSVRFSRPIQVIGRWLATIQSFIPVLKYAYCKCVNHADNTVLAAMMPSIGLLAFDFSRSVMRRALSSGPDCPSIPSAMATKSLAIYTHGFSVVPPHGQAARVLCPTRSAVKRSG